LGIHGIYSGAVLDETVTNVALPAFERAFGRPGVSEYFAQCASTGDEKDECFISFMLRGE
jgi:hypothetical protein